MISVYSACVMLRISHIIYWITFDEDGVRTLRIDTYYNISLGLDTDKALFRFSIQI